MSETPVSETKVSGITDSVHGNAVCFVQPREIVESAFRAMCAAGADPAEAQEGGLAVLRAEVDSKDGLALLEQLLAADWAQPVRAAGTKATVWAGVTVHELDCPDQPALRSAMQLIDLAASGGAEEVRVSRTTCSGIPRQLWNDLLLRRSANLRRTIIVAISTKAGTEYLSVNNGTVTSASEPPSTALAASLLPPSDGENTVVVVLPGTSGPARQDANICQNPLKVSDHEWHRMYQLSRNYLMADR
ncbi:hypothetical protein [Paenarthrobacter sp. PH39-S1]|uniref:hypothetical protein n=1 Tax=Paenarthrobacter sp. PH39-S1 TaxID=3046204 RepID=UPI0024B94475|nr:hypothetical protein [Paenarthrobacter sp. PH39-S1]MDJ0358428.1 hypothetical protein [Paenarthrobacter sp. PH39-S1]